ncbi:SanA/YdcF family protein [Acidaminobacterium chupaoyuni]
MPKKYKKLFFWLAALLLCGAAVFGLIQWRVLSAARPYLVSREKAPRADAILVLGARVYQNGSPSPALRDRLDEAAALYFAGKAPKLILSGDHGTPQYDEVNAMRRYLLEKGVPGDDLFLDHAGFETYDSLFRAKAVFGAKKLIAVSQNYHVPRAVFLGRRMGIETYGVGTTNSVLPNPAFHICRESLARVKAFLWVDVLHPSPKYLGETIDLSGSGKVTWDEDQ